MRLHTDSLVNNLHSHTHHTQNILAGLNNAANTHEQVSCSELKMRADLVILYNLCALENEDSISVKVFD